MAAETEERARVAMSRASVQGVEMGAGSCAVFWHRLGECGTGSDGVEGRDGCDDYPSTGNLSSCSFFYSEGVKKLMQLQFLAPVEFFLKQLKGYSF